MVDANLNIQRPVTVAVVNDFELVVHGTAALLAPYRHRVVVVETLVKGAAEGPVDVALFDTFAAPTDDYNRISQMVLDGDVRSVLVYTWDPERVQSHPFVVSQAAGVIAKTASSHELVRAIESTARGEAVDISLGSSKVQSVLDPLSAREAEVVALIAEGLTNPDIAARLHVSTETIKTYASRCYTKLGVQNRTQAAAWALRNGLQRVS